MMLGTHRPKPVHVRIDNGQVVKHTYTVMPKVPLEKWKSRGAGVVHTPYRGMTTKSHRYRRLQLERVAREAAAVFVPGSVLISAAR
jgi:hypothetical protein